MVGPFLTLNARLAQLLPTELLTYACWFVKTGYVNVDISVVILARVVLVIVIVIPGR